MIKRLVTLFAFIAGFSSIGEAQYLGSWKIDDVVTFVANTHNATAAGCEDASAVPSYRLYENETSTPITTGDMALLDSSNTCGFYSEAITLAAATGFEKGKAYSIYMTATVSGVTGTTSRWFQIEAEVDSNTVTGVAPANFLDAAAVASDVAAEVQTGLYTIRKNVASQKLPVWMIDSSGVAVTGLAAGGIVCSISIDYGVFATTNDTAEAEVGLGLYVIDLTQAETNGSNVEFSCTGTGASVYRVSITPQR